MAEQSEDDCLATSRAPLAIGYIRQSLQTAIETNAADTLRIETSSDGSGSTEGNDEPGW
jgi:hypothetical protein